MRGGGAASIEDSLLQPSRQEHLGPNRPRLNEIPHARALIHPTGI
jgi:hypothetical protein